MATTVQICCRYLLYRKLRFHKAKNIICPCVTRCACSEMDYSKTVAALRRSRFFACIVFFLAKWEIMCYIVR